MTLSIPFDPFLYSACAVAGSLAGALALARLPVKSPLPPEAQREYHLAVLVWAVLGAYSIAPLSWVLCDTPETGRSIIAGLLFGWIGAEITKWFCGITAPTGDRFAVVLPLAIGIGRLGCLFGHCCDGVPYGGPLALEYQGQLFFPYPLAESAFHLWSFLFIAQWARAGRYEGQLLRIYVGGYCMFRFLAEYFRPSPKELLGLSLYQWMSVTLLAIILGKIAHESRSSSTFGESRT